MPESQRPRPWHALNFRIVARKAERTTQAHHSFWWAGLQGTRQAVNKTLRRPSGNASEGALAVRPDFLPRLKPFGA